MLPLGWLPVGRTLARGARAYTWSPGTAPELVNEPVVIDERVTTAAGVASGMDLAIRISAISKDLPARPGSRRGDHTVAL
jgi:hypothetical protein